MPPTRPRRARVVERLADGAVSPTRSSSRWEIEVAGGGRDEGRRGRLPGLQLRPRRAARARAWPAPRRARCGTRRRPARRRRWSSCPAASPTATTCARARWRASARSWARSATTPRAAAWCWASATASRCWPRRACVPGALLRNATLRFEHRWVRLSVERRDTPFTRRDPGRRDAAHAHRPRRGQLLPAGRRPRRARGARRRRVPLRGAGGQPQRLGARHRGRHRRAAAACAA